jgi:hypothetical protein
MATLGFMVAFRFMVTFGSMVNPESILSIEGFSIKQRFRQKH